MTDVLFEVVSWTAIGGWALFCCLVGRKPREQWTEDQL
jgi:hypothetical protein